jgi:hypothetical protein
MSPRRVQAREINGYVNKPVDNYVDDYGKPSIFDDFELFA